MTQSTPGQGSAGVLLIAVAVGVAGQVEPVPCPALAVMRRASRRSTSFS